MGISHQEFWQMSLREFDRVATVRLERRRIDYENGLWHTALQVSGVKNTVYGALLGRKYKPQPAKVLFDAWTGKNTVDERLKRIRAADELHNQRLIREAARRLNSASSTAPSD